MQTLAITGASGFLGRYLVAECLSQACFKLRLLTRNKNNFRHMSSDKITVCEGDLLRPETLKGFLQPNITLVHLAYLNNAGYDANIQATSNLIEAVKQSGLKRIVHCSTAVVVGFDAGGVVTENTPPKPKGEYQQIKYRIEEMLRAKLSSGSDIVILRPTEIIGPGGRGLQGMIKRLRSGKKYKNFIYHCILGSRRFNYVSVYNVVSALILLSTTSAAVGGEIYNISDDDDCDNNYASIENIIASSLNLPQGYIFNAGLSRPLLSALFRLLPGHSPVNRVYSSAKIALLGYKKTSTLKATITELLRSEKNSAHS